MTERPSSGPAETPAHHLHDDGIKPFRVLVCFKAVPELEALIGSDWQPDDRFRIDARFVKTVINPLDESALELSLKLRDQAEKIGLSVDLTALTVGDGKADSILKTLYALKFNRAARIASEVDLRFCSEQVAVCLFDFISSSDHFDLIVMGGRSADGDNARTPLLLAETLGRPCLAQVTEFQLQDGGLAVVSLTDDGELVQLVRPPLVLAVGNAPSSYLRIPTLKDRMAHGKKEPELLPANLEESKPSYEIRSLQYERPERDVVIIDEGTPAEKAARLYNDYLKGRL